MKTVKEWKDFCYKNGSSGLIYRGHELMDAIFDILDDWELSEKGLSDINKSTESPARKLNDGKIKRYRFGISKVCPTDCTLFITDRKIYKVFGIDSESWKMVSSLRKLSPSGEIPDNHDAASIARHLLYSNVSEDEIERFSFD